MFDLNDAPSTPPSSLFSTSFLPALPPLPPPHAVVHYPFLSSAETGRSRQQCNDQQQKLLHPLSQDLVKEAGNLGLSLSSIPDDKHTLGCLTLDAICLSHFSDVSSSPRDSDRKLTVLDGLEPEISTLAWNIGLVKDNGKAAEKPAICLSLENKTSQYMPNSSNPEENETKQLLLLPMRKVQKPDLFGLALGRSSIDAESISFSSKQSIVGSPFWNGEFCFEGCNVVRATAYSLGLLKPNSRLRKLPHIMNLKKFVTYKEFMDRLNTGVTEPVIKIVPPADDSPEDVESFQFTVKTLLGESNITVKDDCQLELELGYRNAPFRTSLASYAAVVSFGDSKGDMLQAELFLVAPASFQEALQIWLPNISICAVEEVDGCDYSSLYGIFLFSESNHGSLVDRKSVDELDCTEQSASCMLNSLKKKFTIGKLIPEVDKEQNIMEVATRSLSTLQVEGVKVAVESSLARELSQLRSASSVLYPDDLQSVTVNDGKEGTDCRNRESKNQFDGHKFSFKRHHQPEEGMKLARQGIHSENLSDKEATKTRNRQSKDKDQCYWTKNKDDPRPVQRQALDDERMKECIPYWQGKDENRVSERDMGRDHENSRKSRESRDKEKNGEQGREKEKGKLETKQEKDTEAVNSMLDVDKHAANMENVTLPDENDPLYGNQIGKKNKKREREEDNYSDLCMRSSKGNRTSFENVPEPVQSGKVIMQLKPEFADDICRKRTDEIDSGELCSKEIIKGASCSFKVDSLFRAKENGAKNIELDATMYSIADADNLQSRTVDDASEGNVGNCQIELPSVKNLGSKTLDTHLKKAGESAELSVNRTDVSVVLPLAKVEGNEANCEFLLLDVDRETRSWLTSKQSMLYFQEEYGVMLVVLGERHDSNPSPKSEHQQGAVHVRITMTTSDTCDGTEATWFVNQAADMVRLVASHGVFSKCLWYEGPVQVETSNSVPSIAAVVKKIKGEDRKNLERIQDGTGVMIGVVLKKGVTIAAHESNMTTRFIGLRLKCIRRKGLQEASKQAEALLSYVADFFLKELAANVGTSQDTGLLCSGNYSCENLSPSRALAVAVKSSVASSPTKVEDSFSGQLHLSAGDDGPALTSYGQSCKVLGAETTSFDEQTGVAPFTNLEGASIIPLYVSNLPESITASNIQDVFESILNQKLGLSQGANLVVSVRYIPDKHSAFIEFANETLLNDILRLFAEDESIFCGFKLECGLPLASKLARQSSVDAEVGNRSCNSDGKLERGLPIASKLSRQSSVDADVGNMGRNSDGNLEELKYVKEGSTRNDGDYSRQGLAPVSSSESGSEHLNEQCIDGHDACSRKTHLFEKPKPLFLTELMRNASGQTIKQLFEEIIKKYISPSLVSSGGRQLVLDVRYVPSRGCAFVDLATPELVKFMLELHSQRPEVFYNMKMELGRRPVPHFLDDDPDRRLPHSRDSTSGRSRSHGYVSGGNYTHRDLAFSSQRQTERRLDISCWDYECFEDSDRTEDFTRQSSFAKRRRSDPEKTVYVDRLPECATETTIRKIFDHVLFQKLTQEQRDAFGNELITEVRYVPSKFCAFIVFCAEELTHLVLQLYNKDEDIFDKMRLKPHFHSRMEDLYRDDLQERDNDAKLSLSKDRILDRRGSHHESDDLLKVQHAELYDGRSHLASHRSFAASAFKEVDRRRSVYVDRIPEDISETTMRELFEKVFRRKMRGRDLHMVSQVTFFRDKYDPKKLCAFVEVRKEDATRDLIECYNANEGAFLGMRIRLAMKYNS